MGGGDDIALFEPDPVRFAAMLLAAWRAGRRVWLAADQQPATVAALREAIAAWSVGAAPREVPLVLFTSGSTGAPQPIGKTFRQLDAEIAALEATFGERFGDAAIRGTVSHQHIYGLLFRVLWPLATGRGFDSPRIEFPGQWAVQAAAGDVLVTTPSLLAQWPPMPDAPTPALVVSSGGPLPADVGQRVAVALGAPVVEVFGSTETGGIAWRDAAVGAGWKPLPGVEWRIEEERLVLRSPHLDDASAWMPTADRAAAFGEGDFVLLGRADRIAKVGEKRVSLDALEARIRESGWIDDVRALVVPGLRRGLAVVACPNADGLARWTAGGRRGLAAELRRGLLSAFEPSVVPRHWRFVETMPSNAQGKVTEAALAALFRPRAPVVVSETIDDVRHVLRLAVPTDLLFFDGHFDVAPVVPGVVLVDWAVAQVENAFGLKPPLAGIEVLKFQKLVLPGAALSLRLERLADGRGVAFAYESAEGSHASGRLRYAPGAAA
jgi:acyl-coenzyme A synthetase/AMP-(fatty) acid ligase/3-hydroxymyristoyl/3-hydroxydecanoyl-(acyl carrier protein) dehydratase